MLVPYSICARVGTTGYATPDIHCEMRRTLSGYELRFGEAPDVVVLTLDDHMMLLSGAWNDVSKLRKSITQLIETQLPRLNTEVAVNDTLALIGLFLQGRSSK
jgi:hypothetical protein